MRLFRFELKKLLSSRAFYICILIMMALVIVTLVTSQLLADQLGVEPTTSGKDSFMRAIADSSLAMMLGIFISIFVCEDYQIGIVRNILSRGYSLVRIFFSKYLTVCIAALIMAMFCYLASFIAGTALFGIGTESVGAAEFKTIAYQILIVLAYASLYCCIASILQKTGGSIAVSIVLPLIATVVLQLVDTAINSEDLKLSYYWLDNLSVTASGFDVAAEDLRKVLLSALAYIGVTAAAGCIVTAKKEY